MRTKSLFVFGLLLTLGSSPLFAASSPKFLAIGTATVNLSLV